MNKYNWTKKRHWKHSFWAGSLEQYLTRNRNKQNNVVAKENTGIIQHKANVLPQKNSHTSQLYPIYQSAHSLLWKFTRASHIHVY